MVRLLERSHFGDVYAKTPAYRKDDVTLTFGFTWDKNKCLLDEIPFMNSKLHPSWTFSLFILSHLMFFYGIWTHLFETERSGKDGPTQNWTLQFESDWAGCATGGDAFC